MSRSEELFQRAQQLIPGGVNSPVRAFAAVGGQPVFIKEAKGAYLTSVDRKKYIDYVGSWGPAIVGHAHDDVVAAVCQAATKGLSFGAPSELENQLAERICAAIPSIEQVRMVSSGTEATMSAVRLARGFTGRDKIIKFEGCYHGHGDALLVKAGSGALTLGVPTSPGIPKSFAAQTLVQSFNDEAGLREVFSEQGDEIACVIVEPIPGNMNLITPTKEFIHTLQELCDHHGTLLICDEVMTGFRVALGGAQSILGIRPDITTLGKVIGGGMPVGAFGGRRDVMQKLSPAGPVYQAGTLSGNPLAMTAGLATLRIITQPDFFQNLETKTHRLVNGLLDAASSSKIPLSATGLGGMFGFAFTQRHPLRNFSDAESQRSDQFQQFFNYMLENGVYFAPSCFEAGFMSSAHSESDIDKTIGLAKQALQNIT